MSIAKFQVSMVCGMNGSFRVRVGVSVGVTVRVRRNLRFCLVDDRRSLVSRSPNNRIDRLLSRGAID